MAGAYVDVKGINASGIESIISKLDSYKEAVNTCLTDVGNIEEGKLANAIKGDATIASVKAFGASIKAGCENTLNDLDRFRTALLNLKATYEKNDQSNTTFKASTDN